MSDRDLELVAVLSRSLRDLGRVKVLGPEAKVAKRDLEAALRNVAASIAVRNGVR